MSSCVEPIQQIAAAKSNIILFIQPIKN